MEGRDVGGIRRFCGSLLVVTCCGKTPRSYVQNPRPTPYRNQCPGHLPGEAPRYLEASGDTGEESGDTGEESRRTGHHPGDSWSFSLYLLLYVIRNAFSLSSSQQLLKSRACTNVGKMPPLPGLAQQQGRAGLEPCWDECPPARGPGAAAPGILGR